MREPFAAKGFRHADAAEVEKVKPINRNICRFAYNAVFAQSAGQEALIRQHSDQSPVLETTTIQGESGEMLFHQNVFGKRRRKPKWED